MIDALLEPLAWLHRFSDPLAWLVLFTFAAGVVAERYDRSLGRPVTTLAWVVFAVFWLSLFHYYAVDQKSIVEGVGSLIAVPASLYAGYLLFGGRDSLFVLSRAVAVMGLVFMPFETIAALRRPLIETVTQQTAFLMTLLGYDPQVVAGMAIDGVPIVGKQYPYRSTFLFYDGDHRLTYTIRIACTGIGSMAIFGGLIAAVDAPLDRKLRAFAVSIPIIWGLNLVRNVFIAITFGYQKLHLFPDVVLTLFAAEDPYRVSFFIADRILAQFLSVAALVGITWFVVRELPDVLTIIEDVLYMATRTEYDLQAALGVGVRADGRGPENEAE